MELWCKSKRWINTVVLLTSAFERSANISPNKSGRAYARFPPQTAETVFCNELHILLCLLNQVLFGVGDRIPYQFHVALQRNLKC